MRRTLLAVVVLALLAAACSPNPGSSAVEPGDWPGVLSEADGQTVRWWLFGGDERVNRFIDDHVAPAAADLGVTVQKVPVDSTVEAVRRVLAELEAGRDDGGVDLVWVNGENFALGREAGAWLTDWATRLPNSALVDWSDPAIATDFGVPVDGDESPWARAAFVFAHDPGRTPDPPRSFVALLDYARQHPGRVTYPAPPDFTGAAFVRQAVTALGEHEAFALLAELKPLQWREGEAFPGSEAELSRLFADGQVDLAMSYDPTFVATAVHQGAFGESVRPFTFTGGTLQNTSYVAIPRNAANTAGALVVADLLLSPELQAIMNDPAVWGMPTVLDLDRLDADQRDALDAVAGPHVPADLGDPIAELPVDRVEPINRRWRQEVAR
ncbi:MAG TPA: ABC transporter substrate-binding protein [Egibacteraceae bacterium]|jgi:putative spermidine/putrescine transport system substrate-binding protein|nr:ABC transporter substrate-binding protein [Egibacteraceae bacterium]